MPYLRIILNLPRSSWTAYARVMTDMAEPPAEYVAAPPQNAGLFKSESARAAALSRHAANRAVAANGITGNDPIADRMVSKASTAIGSLNPRDMKDSDKLALARAAIDVAGLKRQQATARDLDAEILAVYQAISETPDATQP